MDNRQNFGVTHRYPYDPRTHTFLSPSGMAYPAPNSYRPPSPSLAGPLSGPGVFQSGPQQPFALGTVNGHGEWNDGTVGGIHAPGQGQYSGLGNGVAHPSLPPRPPVGTPVNGSPLWMSSQTSRSSTLDAPTRPTSSGPHLSASPRPPFQRSPSAPLEPRRDKRKVSPDPSGHRYLENDERRTVSDLPGRARKSGGPPKAILGGVGGKTFDEMQLAKATSRPPKPTSVVLDPAKPPSPPKQEPSRETPTSASKWKGSNVSIKLPPSHYNPPDTPTADKPVPQHPPPEVEENKPKKSRKDAYPWPQKHVLSGSSTSERRKHAGNVGTMRRSKAPIISGEFAEPSWRGKEVLVGLPSQDAWGSLFARAEEVKKRKGVAEQDARDGFMENEPLPQVERHSHEEPLDESRRDPADDDKFSTDLTSEVISKGRLGNSAFLKRSLGGILRDGTIKDGSNRSQRRAISDVFSILEDPSPIEASGHASFITTTDDQNSVGTKADPGQAREGAPSPEFVEIPLSAANAHLPDAVDEHDPEPGSMDGEKTPRMPTQLGVEDRESGLKSPLSELGDLRTITPAKSRRFGPLAHQGLEDATENSTLDEQVGRPGSEVGAVPNPAEAGKYSEATAVTSGSVEHTVSSRPAPFLRADAGAFRPMSSRNMSTSSISSSVLGLTTQPTKLRPGASAFVPGHRSVSSMSVASDSDSTHSASAAKKALRASAAAFQPKSKSGQVSRSSSVSVHSPQRLDHENATSVVSTPSPQKRVISLRADAATWQLTSRTTSISSSTASRPMFTDTEGDHSFETSETGTVSPVKHSMPISPTKLHANTRPFVSFQPGIRSVSSPQPDFTARTDVQDSDEGGSDREERDVGGKRAKLRPSAVVFVPSRSVSATINRRQGLTAQEKLAAKEGDGKRLVPDTFVFAPTLRPTAAVFNPRFGTASDDSTDKRETVNSVDRNVEFAHETSTPQRAQVETVASSSTPLGSIPNATQMEPGDEAEPIGADSPAALLHNMHGPGSLADSQDGDASSVEDVRESVDLSGLFYRPRQDTVSTQPVEDGPTVWRGEASPRDPVNGHWQEAVDDCTHDIIPRLSRMERSNSSRSNENSHLPLHIATRPRSAVDFTVSEVAIHPSHPFDTPLISARHTGNMPDVPRSAHTQHASGSVGLPLPDEPVPPLPVFARAQTTPPGSTLAGMFTKPPFSALPGGISDPFASSPPLAATPAGDSPASRYSQSSAWSPAKHTSSPIKLSQTPLQRRRPSAASTNGNETFTTADGSPLIPSRSVVKPLSCIPRSNLVDLVPLRSGSPEPIATDDSPVHQPSEAPSIRIDRSNDKRFRQWIFPLHDLRPSLLRRHTVPTELSPEILNDGTAGPGIASTSFAERVGDLRAATSGHRALSSSLSDPGQLNGGDRLEEPLAGREREQSVEFPLRPGNRLLKVVNDAPSRASSMVPRLVEKPNKGTDQAESLKAMLERLEARLLGSVPLVDSEMDTKNAEHLAMAHNQLSASLEALQRHTALLTDIQQAQKRLTDTAAAAALSTTEYDPRAQEMFQAMLTGQHAMLDKFVELSEGKTETWQAIESIRLANLQMYDQLAQHTTTQDRVDTLTAELEGLRGSVARLTESAAKARSAAGIYKSRLDDAWKDRDALRDEAAQQTRRLQSLEIKVKDQEAENDKRLAMRLAAELERDTLSTNLLDVRDEFDKMAEELGSVQAESARVVEERDALRADLRAREAAQDLTRQSEIAQLRDITVGLQNSLLTKVSSLEEGMSKAKEVSSHERAHLVEENGRLQEELRGLRQRLDASTETNAALQSDFSAISAKSEGERESLQKQLETEQERRQASGNHLQSLERQLEQVRREMIDARTIATERQAYARMSEVRLQTLTQEAVYWRQFALEADRRKYRTYMASKPFQSSPPDANLQTPAAYGAETAESREEHDVEPKTPTQNGHQAAHPLSRSVVAFSPENGAGGGKEEGQWWGLAA